MDDWSKKRLAELTATAATVKKQRKAKAEGTFVKVPLQWIERATRATRTPQAMVCIWLLHLAWQAKSITFPLPNDKLTKLGVDRRAKRRALVSLEKAGLITVERRHKKAPIVTLVL
jgi:DNA-binding transcriptional ArsR family regulator